MWPVRGALYASGLNFQQKLLSENVVYFQNHRIIIKTHNTHYGIYESVFGMLETTILVSNIDTHCHKPYQLMYTGTSIF